MKIRVPYFNSLLLFQIVFLTFLGYYAILLLAINFGLSDFSRYVTVPVRLIIIFSFLFLLILNFKSFKIGYYTKIFLILSFIFFVRVAVDNYNDSIYYLSSVEVFFYFLFFSFIPFVSISTIPFSERLINIIIKSIITSGILFSILSLIFYSNFIGEVGRLSSKTVGEDVVSPLSLSYSSTLIIGVVIIYFIYNKRSILEYIVGFAAILLSIVPFFLGASRGSLIALFIPFLVVLLVKVNIKRFFLGLIFIFFSFYALIYLSEYFGSNIFDRFFNLSNDIEQGNNSTMRLGMWENSFHQFINNPFFGDKLGVNGFSGYYPHNIILEVLQSLGVIGFVPIFILIYSGISNSLSLIKFSPQYSWVTFIFFQSTIKGLFSGTFYNSSWFWFSLALVFAVNRYTKNF
ncbi:O-antigen ligase like membrane protein [Cyclobacterium lianum]|uniref:O-antigen ligase like membrane protein n=1 Tax=Cyclobacterium lianum TaxID=388280 RepID=A0A1M7NT93_9BACT|nr:O-antigen ligase family protein [Cyclobacterium lianum]SHN06895.1 O-antigen ligase like membrane protein [Cyclobacterium lianum]